MNYYESQNSGEYNRIFYIPEQTRELTGLKKLVLAGDLDNSWGIADIRPLSTLIGLQRLNLSRNQVSNIRPLAILAGLQSLSLSYTQVSDIRPLSTLTGLQGLDLSRNQVSDIRPLFPLIGLQSLYLSGAQISDIRPLSNLTCLQSLSLSYTQVSDIRPLSTLTRLQSLDLNGAQVSDISPLSTLTGLQRLYLSGTQVSDISPLTTLTRLQRLYLSYTQVSDIRPLSTLTGLQSLYLSGAQNSDISQLSNLTGIQRLNLSDNRIPVFPLFLLELPQLTELNLFNNPIENVPAEIINQGESWNSNCLQRARDYFAALAKEAVPNNEVKLIMLGNGRVGKTSLVRAMLDREFDEEQESTNKIVLRTLAMEGVKPNLLKESPLSINIWDFGGQEIYYTTHRLFLKTNALFLLVWDRETEEADRHEDGYGNSFANFKLLHWIDFIRTASRSPVIVVQNKMDNRRKRYTGHEELLRKHYKNIFDFQYVSAKKDHENGMPDLQDCIKDAYGEMPEVGRLIGKQWMAVKEDLHSLQERHTITYQDYLEICQAKGLEGTEPETLIHFLHDSGFLFYLQDITDPCLILDQRWAIDAAYAVLQRGSGSYNEFCRQNRHGFTPADLDRLVWGETYPAEEQKQLLSFMVTAGICFEYSKGVYIAPQMLPPERPPRVGRQRKWKEPEGHAMKFRYQFLHNAIIEHFIIRAGRMVGEDDPAIWRNGIEIYDESCDTYALVEANLEQKEICVWTNGGQTLVLLQKIKEELSFLNRDYNPEVLFSIDGGAHFVLAEKIKEFSLARAEMVPAEHDELTELAPLLQFLRMEERQKQGMFGEPEKRGLPEVGLRSKRMEPEKPILKCFISYAHGRKNYFEVFKDEFETLTANLPFAQLDIWTDEHVLLGDDWHETIQKEIEACDMAILLVSDEFMTSKYIKEEEVDKLFDRSQGNNPLVVPVYIYPCCFDNWPVFKKKQLFKPQGAAYGRPEKDKKNKFCYAHLVEFDGSDPQPNPERGEYMLDFIDRLEPQLKKIAAQKS